MKIDVPLIGLVVCVEETEPRRVNSLEPYPRQFGCTPVISICWTSAGDYAREQVIWRGEPIYEGDRIDDSAWPLEHAEAYDMALDKAAEVLGAALSTLISNATPTSQN